jgi:hypothetical protein
MSRAYRVTWVAAARTVTASDRIRMDVDLLDILPEGDMSSLLREQLKADGWKDHGGELVLDEGDVRATLSRDGKTIELTHEAERAVNVRSATKQEAERQADAAATAAEEDLKARAAERLARVEPVIREKLGKSLQRVYVEALRRKAQSLGEVESMQESVSGDGELEVVIKVKA